METLLAGMHVIESCENLTSITNLEKLVAFVTDIIGFIMKNFWHIQIIYIGTYRDA